MGDEKKLYAERIAEIVREHLTDIYCCNREWSGWQAGTMTEGDFTPAGEIEMADEIALAILNSSSNNFDEEMACIKLLADIRQACGDDGKRMQGELVEYIAELYRKAERVEHLQVRVNGFEDTLKRQANAAKSGMDAAKKAASQSEKNAKRLLAESNPASLESERAMNEELTHEIDMLQDSLIWQGKMLAAIANVIKGPPEEGSLHSTHDVVEGVERLQARVQLEQEQN